MDDTTICPRCAYRIVEEIFSSPIPDVWDVLQCRQCHYMWRTSEPARRTRRDAYPEAFRMTLDDIDGASEMPPVPPLRAAAPPS
ncbi:non-oxidative hydroxyarylic acid decarboxylases subunit D [Actinomadura sp. DC4]|uniref:non-oxidative hydroxyarylic acid decarboxylases subunit D n=1 Tax=Actinomadura sp. DC4 TaxID=3055069 RepID=UPI0025B1258F|nr:non-oxidative hydroxyarylic acid decarboxylases subunit D [Actinomadura sp. DC4]MDN3352195.1 non-oxidative hydroxyarylic acid decarboxylases subunit D [Actinomadura sp. DC4]